MAHPDKMAVLDIESQHPTDHDELESFFAGESPPHPHDHYSSRAPWLRAGVLGANDGVRLSAFPPLCCQLPAAPTRLPDASDSSRICRAGLVSIASLMLGACPCCLLANPKLISAAAAPAISAAVIAFPSRKLVQNRSPWLCRRGRRHRDINRTDPGRRVRCCPFCISCCSLTSLRLTALHMVTRTMYLVPSSFCTGLVGGALSMAVGEVRCQNLLLWQFVLLYRLQPGSCHCILHAD